MIKKTLLGIAMSAGMVSAVVATEPSTVEFDVRANVPTQEFYVTKDGSWDNIVLSYDAVGEKFNTNTSNYLRARNTTGSINGYLEHAPTMLHTDLTTRVPLFVSVNGTTLKVGSADAVAILADTEANIAGGAKLPLFVGSSETKVKAGDYSGRVVMMFDAVPTPPVKTR